MKSPHRLERIARAVSRRGRPDCCRPLAPARRRLRQESRDHLAARARSSRARLPPARTAGQRDGAQFVVRLSRAPAAAGGHDRAADHHRRRRQSQRRGDRRSRRRRQVAADGSADRSVESARWPPAGDRHGCLRTQNGQGRFELQQAAVSGVPIPKSVLQELVSYYSRTAEDPGGHRHRRTVRAARGYPPDRSRTGSGRHHSVARHNAQCPMRDAQHDGQLGTAPWR